jgi:tRNA nucleotidyltransferase (CCA-adding enzyme)
MNNELYNILVINLFLYYNNKFQRGKVDKAALEDMASCIEDLKKENENYSKQNDMK